MFKFGQNWQTYSLNALDESKLEQAKQALASLIDQQDLHGKTFIDIGCGAGLNSISAAMFGADHIYALDIDPQCIAVTTKNVERFLPPGQAGSITAEQLSVLDSAAMNHIPQAEIVYSWGVLHHTGHMIDAIQKAAALVTPGGLFVIAIYNKHITSRVWHTIKAIYNRVPSLVQRVMYYLFYGVIFVAKFAATRRNPLHKERGMSFGYDVIDWIGGYPYEYASIEEIVTLVSKLGFTAKKVVPAEVGTGCNEFVFVRTS